MHKLKRLLAVLALLLGLATVTTVISEGVASASWSCSVSQGYSGPQTTFASCYTDTPYGTLGWVYAKQLCGTSTTQYWQYGYKKKATYHNGWTGISETPVCPGYVLQRSLLTGYDPE